MEEKEGKVLITFWVTAEEKRRIESLMEFGETSRFARKALLNEVAKREKALEDEKLLAEAN